MKKNKRILLISMLFISLLLAGCEEKTQTELETITYLEESSQELETQETKEVAETESTQVLEKSICYVHICGAVERPGVYQVESGSRIFEAVQLAGGFSTEASEDYLNQALPIEDGMKIEILTETEAQEARKAEIVKQEAEQESQSGLINLNTATKEMLCTLPGVGESKANSIISYREQKGSFAKVQDIMQVEGIKEGLYEKIKELITV